MVEVTVYGDFPSIVRLIWAILKSTLSGHGALITLQQQSLRCRNSVTSDEESSRHNLRALRTGASSCWRMEDENPSRRAF